MREEVCAMCKETANEELMVLVSLRQKYTNLGYDKEICFDCYKIILKLLREGGETE